MRRLALVVLAVATASLAGAGAAAADSLVFIKSNNVWLANGDGSNQYQVTLDGSPASPYSSPSQADDGTIVALRTPSGGRPQIWRMTQSGGLLNPPINTPAPGTGAIDARVSPDGKLVAYWFVTEVSTGTCLYCFDLAQRVLISHSDSFTNPDAVGTPNTGGWPSWMSNNQLMLSIGAAEEWYYKLGMTEAVAWWADYQNCGSCTLPAIVNLTDGEVSRDGQRVAVVRGNKQETIALYTTNGPPPSDTAAPPVPTARCAFTGPNGGKFVRPTWSLDGQTLAWQEGNGIWSAHIPDITNCTTISPPQLTIPGGADADLGPAAVNPGARPPCGNPGNPAGTPACATPPPIVVVNRQVLVVFLTTSANGLKRLAIHGLLRKGRLALTFTAPGAGTLTVQLKTTGRHPVVVASGQLVFTAAGKRTVVLKLTAKGRNLLRHARHFGGTLKVMFTPRGGSPVSATLGVSVKR